LKPQMAALLRGQLSRVGRHRVLPLLLHGKARFNVLVETYVAAGASLLFGSCGGYLLASTLYTQRLQQHMATHTERLAKETERRASSEGQLQRLDKELTALRAAQRVADMDTGAFLKSLTVPHTLGRWGELSLRRIVELSGMQQHVDFDEQITVLDKEGDVFRVDMVVKMHSKRYIVVDSKVPLNAFEETLAAKDEKEERAKMKKYSAAIRKHVLELRSLPPPCSLVQTVSSFSFDHPQQSHRPLVPWLQQQEILQPLRPVTGICYFVFAVRGVL
jgi:hypothetical protein